MTLVKFKNAIKRAKARRHEIWKEEMEEIDRTAFGYYICKR